MNRTRYRIVPQMLIALTLMSAAMPGATAEETKALPPMTAMNGTGTLVPPKDPKRFAFVVFGDSQGQEDHPTLRAIFKDMNSEPNPKPTFAISLGDIIKGEPSVPFDSQALEEHLGYSLLLAKLAKVPVFNAPGNHEMDDVVNTTTWLEMPSQQMRAAYEKVVGPTYGSFDCGDSHFIIMNTEDIPPPGMQGPEPPMEFSYVGATQLAQLAADLEANKHKTHVFIAMHYPMNAYDPARDNLFGESRQALVDLFKKYPNISFVLASHEHQFYNPQDPNNVTTVAPFQAGGPTQYLISGGAGASFYSGQPQLWAFHHYLLFEVDGAKVSVTIKRVH
ncbi:MAG: metallophosphoesterase [Planctomycetes bacterium]|nr:metallophosphoesterase [Planctomycetota bacterium]